MQTKFFALISLYNSFLQPPQIVSHSMSQFYIDVVGRERRLGSVERPFTVAPIQRGWEKVCVPSTAELKALRTTNYSTKMQ